MPVDDRLWQEFHDAVNMTSRELQDWLRTAAADTDAEALPDQAGPELGRRVVEVLGKRRTDITDSDATVMTNVIDLVRREDPGPDGGSAGDRAWRRRLMTVGHDPLKPRR
jgi:hypothetical protein